MAFVERVGDEGRRRRLDAASATPNGPAWPKHNRRASDNGLNGHRPAAATVLAERRTWAPGTGHTLVACVDVQPTTYSGVQPERNDLLWRLALRRMERCIRPDDQVCMLGGPRVAVVLGNGSNRVAPSALGRRLARAMGDHLAVGATGLDLHVAIGIGAGTTGVEPAALASAAMASLRLTRGRPGSNEHGQVFPFVAVTHVPDHQALAAPGLRAASDTETADACRRLSARQPRRLDYRVLVPLSEDLGLSAPAAITPNGTTAFGPGDTDTSLSAPGLRVLLVDPEANPDHSPRPVMEAVASVARRFGTRPVISFGVDSDAVLLDFYLAKPDLVVIVVQAEVLRHGSGHQSNYPWDRPARITRALRQAGTPVIALSVGASAAALAVCVEQGAVGLLHADLLAQELARQASRRIGANGASSQNGCEEPRGPGQLPAPYDALVHLTPSERRVLFHMMEGRSAAEIATTLVVSLTTVRSHIRSILRKLNVNSQLAAVALAFGTLPDQAVAN
jgi:DNA-binding NarL/FixJ family response regulator